MVLSAITGTQHRIATALEASGVPSQWFSVLHLLLHADEHRMPMTQLARDVSITPGGFTKLADRMGREGLIDRRGSTGDRRVVYATLTDKGLDAARRAETEYLAALRAHVLALIPEPTLEQVSQLLAPLNEAPVEAPVEEAEAH